MLRRLASGAALVAAAAMVLVGCTPPEPTETTPAVTAEPSPSASAVSDAEVAAQAFERAMTLNRLVDRAFQEGALPVADLQGIATPELIRILQADLDQFTSRGLRLEGNSVLDTPTLVSHDPTSSVSGSAVLATCMDTSATATFDSSGAVISGGIERQPRLFGLDYDADSMIVTRTGPPEEPLDIEGCSS